MLCMLELCPVVEWSMAEVVTALMGAGVPEVIGGGAAAGERGVEHHHAMKVMILGVRPRQVGVLRDRKPLDPRGRRPGIAFDLGAALGQPHSHRWVKS
jgi:hypothetical protein